jgi:hypothetical protein
VGRGEAKREGRGEEDAKRVLFFWVFNFLIFLNKSFLFYRGDHGLYKPTQTSNQGVIAKFLNATQKIFPNMPGIPLFYFFIFFLCFVQLEKIK